VPRENSQTGAHNVKIFSALLLLCLCGCGQLPTFKYCDDVEYIRKGGDINITAHCRAPVGNSL
jgi:hypothetical protein